MASLSSLVLNPFETYTSDLAYTMVSCLGHYLVKKLKKNINTKDEEQIKNTQQKLYSSIGRWHYANSISDYNVLICSTYEKVEPFNLNFFYQ